MSIREVLRKNLDKIVPSPSSAWEGYVQNARLGLDKDMPVYGQGNRVIFDYYGMNKARNVKQGRIRIPLRSYELEISYHITQTPDGAFHSVREGIFPYAG